MASPRETSLGARTIDGRVLEIERLDWPNGGHSFDVYDEATGDCLTLDESLDTQPTDEELRRLMGDCKVRYNVEVRVVKLIRAASPAAVAKLAREELDGVGWWAEDYSRADVDICEDQQADRGVNAATRGHYLITVAGGIEPEVHGPFHRDEERIAEAQRLHDTQDPDTDAVFSADVTADGTLRVDSFVSEFFESRR